MITVTAEYAGDSFKCYQKGHQYTLDVWTQSGLITIQLHAQGMGIQSYVSIERFLINWTNIKLTTPQVTT